MSESSLSANLRANGQEQHSKAEPQGESAQKSMGSKSMGSDSIEKSMEKSMGSKSMGSDSIETSKMDKATTHPSY